MRTKQLNRRNGSIHAVGFSSEPLLRSSLLAFAVLATSSFAPSAAEGATYSWQPVSGDWSIASNWGSTVLPTTSDLAYVANGGTVNITLANETCGTLSVGDATGASTVQLLGGSLNPQFGGQVLVGDTANGSFYQSGGTCGASAYIGNKAAANGSFFLSGSGDFNATAYVGVYGNGVFTQTGGTNNALLYLGYYSSGSGTYSLNGGLFHNTNVEYGGYSGTGLFQQSGGTNSVGTALDLGYNAGSAGTYTISGSGKLSAPSAVLGYAGTGTFIQTGGTNNDGRLYVGGGTGGTGSYFLSGSGVLSVTTSESVGTIQSTTGQFQQTGGSNSTPFLAIGSGGRYLLKAGTLAITTTGGISNQGGLDFTNSLATLAIGNSCAVDLTQATLTNVGSMNVSLGSNSLLIVPTGFNPATGFGSFSASPSCMVHTIGTTLTVAAGQAIGGQGVTFTDPVDCQGKIVSYGTLNMNGGLTVSGTGLVSLRNGNLITNDQASGINAGGAVSSANHYVGLGGSGQFALSGVEGLDQRLPRLPGRRFRRV